MVAALSASMSRSLNALISVNQDIETTQNHINTGKAINDPSDNIAIYFKARSYLDRSDNYTGVNAQITQSTANLDFLDKALSNMIDNVKGARQIMNDAKSKAVTAATAVSFTGQKAYANTSVTPAGGGAARAIQGQIVDTNTGATPNANLNDGGFFQAGDVFRVDIKDASNNSTVSRYFKAVAPDATATPVQTKAGDTSANALEFNDVASLAQALNLGFGRATASFDAIAGAGGTTQLKMALASNTQSITFGQTTDVAVGGAAGASFDFTKLLQGASTTAAAVKVDSSLDATNAANASSWTYAPKAGVTTDTTVTDARKQAADFFRQTIYGLDATVKDAYLPGFANVLKGDTMTVQLNDTNTVSQQVKLAAPIDFTTGTASKYGVGFVNTAGTLTTTYTDTGNANNDNFLSDTQLTAAIAKMDQITVALGQQRQLLAASKTAMSSRLDLNKTMQASLSDTANAMTAADLATETTTLSTLQNRQSFAATGLSISRQSEQYLLNLIR